MVQTPIVSTDWKPHKEPEGRNGDQALAWPPCVKGIARDVGGSTRMSFLVFGSKSPGRGMCPVGSREPDKHSVAGQTDVHTLES